jgi:hypothetical protein
MGKILASAKRRLSRLLANRVSVSNGAAVLDHQRGDQLYHVTIVVPLMFVTRYILSGVVDRGLVDGGGILATGSVHSVSAPTHRSPLLGGALAFFFYL